MEFKKLFNEATKEEEPKKVDTVDGFLKELGKNATADWQSMLVSGLVLKYVAKKLLK